MKIFKLIVYNIYVYISKSFAQNKPSITQRLSNL